MRTWFRANPKLATATVIVYFFMVGAAAISFVDIVKLAEVYGVPAPISYTAPLFIDGLAWLGKIGRSKDFADTTRSAGLKLMAIGGVLSLAANILVGETLGLKVYGALVVAGFVTAEWYSAKLEAKVVVSDVEAPVVTVSRKVQKANADKARELAALSPNLKPSQLAKATGVSPSTAKKILDEIKATAPTSPGHGPVPNAPEAAELEAMVG